MEVNIRSTKRVVILGLDRREPENIGFCAITFGATRLFWVDGYILCLEVYEKAIEHEMEKGEFYISQLCYASFPKYTKVLEIEKGTQIPIVNASDMRIYREIIRAILGRESNSS
ncbi:MAG: hypothetical protein QXF59_06705 [Candidatus Bathyarchaeia archaeon]|nr:hypothetical protein [Candidatus Bathyarchaeota archaeon]